MSEIDMDILPSDRPIDNSLLQLKFFGGMIGSALGDAIGEIVLARAFSASIVDARNIDSLISEDELLRLTYFFDRLEYTDDTHMAIGIAEELVTNGRIIAESLGRTFVKNYGVDGDYRGYGPTTRAILVSQLLKLPPCSTYMETVESQNQKWEGGSCGNGSAMRVTPLGLFCFNKQNVYEQARESTISTHLHPIAIDGTAVLAKAIATITCLNPNKELDVLTFTDELIQFSRNETIIKKLTALRNLLADDSDPCQAAEILGRSILIHESMPFAIFSFLSSPYSFERCLMTAILNGGDCDTLGAMAGGLSGAFLGVEVIPNLWQSKLENFTYIKQLATNLFKKAISVNSE